MSCERCAALAKTVEIREPDELRGVIRAAMDAMESRVLSELPSPDGESVTMWPEGGWPDIIGARFECLHC